MPHNPQPARAVEVFYSYAHDEEDERLKDELLKQLSNIERQGVIISWHDRKITAGREWAGEIDEHINSSGVILLLVSPDFMASGYCNDVELKRAMERHEANEAVVIPVILRPVEWKGAPFDKLEALPEKARPVTLWANQDEALLNVARGIRKAVEEFAARPSSMKDAQPSLANIPRPPVVGFVARRDEQGHDIVERLTEELAPEKSQVVALWGPGGSGKTTLAAEVVRPTENLFAGRVVWASPLRRTDFNLGTLLDEIATQLGRADLRTLAPEPKAAQVAALVIERPTLVVLDNFETIVKDEQGRCLDFLTQNAACPALITTRFVIDRDDVLNVPLDAMSLDEARDFLQRLVERTRKPANFDKLDRDELIVKCEANPLVLQWVVRQIDLAKRPQDVLKDLAQGEGDAAARVFTRSFNLPQLGDDGRDALLALSLFTPSALRESLAEVSGFNDDPRRLSKAVENLSALWLVETTDGNERLFLRGLTRELAKSRLSKDERAADFYRRFVDYFLRHAEAHQPSTPKDLDAQEAEKDNLLAAMDVAFKSQEWEGVMRIHSALEFFLRVRGHWDEALKSGEQAEAAAREANSDWNVASAKGNMAIIRINRGEYKEAGRVYQELLETFRRLGSEGNVAVALHQLGVVATGQGDLEEARRRYRESLQIEKNRNNQSGISTSLHQLGKIAYLQGDLEESRRLFDESLDIKKRLGKQESIPTTLLGLAAIARRQGDLKEARRLYEECLEIQKKMGDQYIAAFTMRNLGLLVKVEGNKVEAAHLLREALRIFEKLGTPEAEKVRKDLARVEGESD